ncbi:MAG: DUF4139 domain-containing protein, partial [Alphaproteobacteria bacterium]|nr:DUF4139 domain-containing protein [Alphaproteobacteria bacterium]
VAVVLPFACAGAGDKTSGVGLTIYSSAQPGAIDANSFRPVPGMDASYNQPLNVPGYAIVRDERMMNLPEKTSHLQFSDVAAYIDPTTVNITSLTSPDDTQVIEQNYLFDLVNRSALLQRFIDKEITVEQSLGDKVEPHTGTLLSVDGDGAILKKKDGAVEAVRNISNIQLPELPGGLITKPTLDWQIATGTPGDQRMRVSYQTGGITWWADYNFVFTPDKNPNKGLLDVNAWVSILNQSGASYDDARLKLMAGEVQRIQPSAPRMYKAEMMMDAAGAAPAPGFAEKSFFEYHLYTLERPATIPDNSTKQLSLFPSAHGVPVEKILLYDGGSDSYYYDPGSVQIDQGFGSGSNDKVAVYLTFKNSKENGLGRPLPAGRIRVNQLDTDDNSMEFIGEDIIGHTPKDEDVRIKLGESFDVKGERVQTDFSVDEARKVMEETYQITLRNHKDAAIAVKVKENLTRSRNWSITKKSHEYEKIDSHTLHFPVTVPANGKIIITYTVKYTW